MTKAKSKPTLPPRKFYTLQQAAEKLTREFKEPVTVEDLIYYWAFDNLNLSIYFSDYPYNFTIGQERYKKPSKKIQRYFFFISDNPFPEMIDFEFFHYATSPINFSEEKVAEGLAVRQIMIAETDDDIDTNDPIYSGFFQILPDVSLNANIQDIIENGYKSSVLDLVSPNQYTEMLGNQLYIRLLNTSNKPINLPLSDFYIMHYDLEQFLQGNAKKTDIADFSDTAPQTTRQKENQVNFIKTLLFYHYQIKTPQEARQAIRSGRLGRDLEKLERHNPDEIERLNLMIPTEKTLFNWLNNQ